MEAASGCAVGSELPAGFRPEGGDWQVLQEESGSDPVSQRGDWDVLAKTGARHVWV